MSLNLITAPTVDPLTEAEVWDHLRVNLAPTEPVDKTLIASLTGAATKYLDGRDGILGRCLVEQTWEMKFDCFPGRRGSQSGYRGTAGASDAMRIPLPPLRSVTSITYIDSNGDSQTLSSSLYTVDTANEPGRIVPVYGESWPSTRDQIDAVTVLFVAGYAPSGASPNDYRINVPTPIKQALLLLIGHWYEHREEVAAGVSMTELPMAADALLTPYRVYGFA